MIGDTIGYFLAVWLISFVNLGQHGVVSVRLASLIALLVVGNVVLLFRLLRELRPRKALSVLDDIIFWWVVACALIIYAALPVVAVEPAQAPAATKPRLDAMWRTAGK